LDGLTATLVCDGWEGLHSDLSHTELTEHVRQARGETPVAIADVAARGLHPVAELEGHPGNPDEEGRLVWLRRDHQPSRAGDPNHLGNCGLGIGDVLKDAVGPAAAEDRRRERKQLGAGLAHHSAQFPSSAAHRPGRVHPQGTSGPHRHQVNSRAASDIQHGADPRQGAGTCAPCTLAPPASWSCAPASPPPSRGPRCRRQWRTSGSPIHDRPSSDGVAGSILG
jgi:hypothetical protein